MPSVNPAGLLDRAQPLDRVTGGDQEAKAAFAKAAEEVEAEERDAVQTAGRSLLEDDALTLPTGDGDDAVAYGDEVTITADMLKMLDDEDED